MWRVGWTFSLVVLLVGLRALAEPPPDFEHDVKPILAEHCFKCHGPDKQKSGLRLDIKAKVMEGGESAEPVLVPGSSLKSHLFTRVVTDKADEVMPPKGARLKPAEVAVLQKWIDGGAHWVEKVEPAGTAPVVVPVPERVISEEDRKFWAFVAPRRGAAGGIDGFIRARLAERGLTPSSEASREVLIRRLCFDLTGLPPTVEEVGAFVADQSPDAYELLVDRLLASPRFGERMASLWLPLARYGEDQAHQVGDDTKYFYPNAFKYREWVINAFNRDLPYDRFVALQIAGDKIDGAVKEDQAALGFLGLGPKYYNRDRLEVMADEWEDRVDTVSRTMLGLTVACARCHDHKFDPISQRDYYALAGVFASVKMVNKNGAGVVQKEAKAEEVSADTVHVVEDGKPRDLNVFIRGNVERKGPVVPRRFLSILSSGTPVPFKEGSGRKELALAIGSRENPLTSRVMVNRMWGMVFGRPLVLTPSNFGHSGMLPSHPELLDDLAVRFMEHGWSIKWLVREMVTSATYRQASIGRAGSDPSNELFWRMNRRRMTIEQWRDSVLFVCGELDGGGGKSMELTDEKNRRRTVYARISRLKLNDLLMQFDYPDANVHAEKRSVTSTPMQKLFVMNSPFMIARAKALEARLAKEAPESEEARVTLAYRMLFARAAEPGEVDVAMEFLRGQGSAKMSRWEEYAQVLLACNEAFYVD